jgi:hypothetical protein
MVDRQFAIAPCWRGRSTGAGEALTAFATIGGATVPRRVRWPAEIVYAAKQPFEKYKSAALTSACVSACDPKEANADATADTASRLL